MMSYPVRVPLIIDGQEVASDTGKTFSRENPASVSMTVANVEHASQSQLDHAVDVAREVFDSNKFQWRTNHKLREKVLYKVGELIRENKDALVDGVIHEIGMPRRQAVPHVLAAADVFEFYAGYANKLYGECYNLSNGDFIALLKEPVGVAGLITPWNFPLTQSARKIGPALAVGCTIVYKPASFVPLSGYLLTKILHQAGLPNGVLNLVFGSGSSIGNGMVSHRKIDKISFTGETLTGIGITKIAAESLKRVSLELGGKNPFVLFEDANFDYAIKALLFGGFRNAGQACGATSRLIVGEKIRGQVLEKLKHYCKELRVGNPKDETTDVGPVVSKDQETKILEYIDYGRNENYRLVFGGRKIKDGDLAGGYFIEPTVFDGVDQKSKLAQEEIFGPVISVIPFKTEDEALSIANDVIYGLTAAVWTNDIGRAFRLSREIKAGTIWVNDNYTQPPEGIWGGYKSSGVGRELSHYGLDDFTEIKQVYVNTSKESKTWYKQVVDF